VFVDSIAYIASFVILSEQKMSFHHSNLLILFGNLSGICNGPATDNSTAWTTGEFEHYSILYYESDERVPN